MTSGAAAASADLDSLYRDLRAAHLHPLWRIERNLLTEHPMPRAIPWVWRAADMYPLGERAIRAVPVNRGGERRVLSLGNPGLGGAPYAAGTLWGPLQCLGPGETAPAHRHTPGAIRFVLTGTGVWTTVNGDRCDMGPGDLVLTPSWYWHDHTNSGDRAMFWFDGLDLPIVEALDAVFYEQYPEHAQPPPGTTGRGRRSRAIRPGTPRRGHIRARIGAAQRSGGPVTPSSSCSAARVAARSAAADWSGPRATCSWFPPGCPPRTGRESARTCSNCRTRLCCARSAYTAKRRFREAPGPDRPPG
ncbi:MAG: cupin domain-containing protein [Trebonia sp.]